MSRFDQLAGLAEGNMPARRPLKTLAEAGAGAKATMKTKPEFGKPAETKAGDPNTAYHAAPKPKIGQGLKFDATAAQLRTEKPKKDDQTVTPQEESRFDALAGLGEARESEQD